MNMAAVHQMAGRVAELLQEKHGLHGPTLKAKLRRGRRLLPRRIRDAADRLALAEEKATNPKLWSQIDLARLTRDYNDCISYLAAIDTKTRGRARLMVMVETVGIGILVLGIVTTAFLEWR